MALTGQQPLIVGVSVALMILATASGALRFFSRWMMRSGLWWDDWCSLLALFLSYAFNISQFVSVGCNMGKHGANVPNEAASITCTAKTLYSVIMIYTICMPSIKVTMVLFYWRLFSGGKKIRMALYTISAMLFAWFVGALASGLMVCEPLSKFWVHTTPGHCLPTITYFRAIAGTNLATDVLLLVLPIPIVWGLHRPASERLALIAVFALGAFVTVVSVIRIALLTSPDDPDPLWANTQGTVWTSVETSIGVVCVNLPTMSPIFRRYILRREVSSANSKPRSLPLSYPPSSKKPTVNRRRGSTSSTEGLETKWSISDNDHSDMITTTGLTVTGHGEEGIEMDELNRHPSKSVCNDCEDRDRDPKLDP